MFNRFLNEITRISIFTIFRKHWFISTQSMISLSSWKFFDNIYSWNLIISKLLFKYSITSLTITQNWRRLSWLITKDIKSSYISKKFLGEFRSLRENSTFFEDQKQFFKASPTHLHGTKRFWFHASCVISKTQFIKFYILFNSVSQNQSNRAVIYILHIVSY